MLVQEDGTQVKGIEQTSAIYAERKYISGIYPGAKESFYIGFPSSETVYSGYRFQSFFDPFKEQTIILHINIYGLGLGVPTDWTFEFKTGLK